jgi:superfamily II DNA or RNA helicase
MERKLDIDIYNFLPKYPDISKNTKNDIFDLYPDDFYSVINRKAEFYNERLKNVENFPSKAGDLMNHQKIIARFLSSNTPYDSLLLIHEMGCLSPDTEVLMWDGTLKRADCVKVNDILVGDDGTPRNVLNLINGKSQMYNVIHDGKTYKVNKDHILTLEIINNKKISWDNKRRIWTIKWFDFKKMDFNKRSIDCSTISKKSGFQYLSLLRDKNLSEFQNVIDINIMDYLNLPNYKKKFFTTAKSQPLKWNKKEIDIDPYEYGFNISNFEKINENILINDSSTRLFFLAGMLDSRGYNEKGSVCVSLIESSLPFSNDLIFLLNSLGIYNRLKEGILFMNGEYLKNVPLLTKSFRVEERNRFKKVSIEPEKWGEYVGWELDGNKRFLLSDFTVTHNTGKTCSAIGAIEQVKSERNGINGALILARGENLLNNFSNELLFKCTDGRYIPENYKNLSELEKSHRVRKSIKTFYDLNTFEVFAKEIQSLQDFNIKNKYSNKFIVIDEVHNLRIQDKEIGLSMYKQFHRFLHVVENCKILLMSGTPMKDDPSEIAAVMNLILPLDKQLPLEEKFTEEYLKEVDGLYYISTLKEKHLKNDIFKGRVSYLKAMSSNVKRKYVGSKIGKLKHFNVARDDMSDFQSQFYNKAYDLDKTEKKGIYSNCRQAALFVFPDGSYGNVGFEKYITFKKQQTFKGKKGDKILNYSATPEFKKHFSGTTEEEILLKIGQSSSKYEKVLRNILNSRKEGKSVFVYTEFVKGSGAVLLAILLEFLGYKSAIGKEEENSFIPRYALITNITASQKGLKNLIERFNKKDNVNGQVINVIIGSRVISEGFSLQNVQVEEILTPHWNYAETSQAIARGYRLGSHKELYKINNNSDIVLKVYQRVSVPNNGIKYSIDLQMYETSETKDINIKKIERLMKESAFDCSLAYDRNFVSGYDGERECDYVSCDYKCDSGDLSDTNIDFSTFQLYYDQNKIQSIIEEIKGYFRYEFNLDILNIYDRLNKFTEFEIITALHKMINENIQVVNKYGFFSYIREENNIYFLVDSLSTNGKLSCNYYSEFMQIQNNLSYKDAFNFVYLKNIINIVEVLFSLKHKNTIIKMLDILPLELQEYIIENCFIAKERKLLKSVESRNIILETVTGKSLIKINNVWTSNLLESIGIIKCFDSENKEWYDCTEKNLENIETLNIETQLRLEKNPYGYYGLVNSKTFDSSKNENFCIRNVSNGIEEKGHKRTSGKRCTNIGRPELQKMVINVLKLNVPEDMISDYSKLSTDELVKKYKDSKIKNTFGKDFYKGLSREEMYKYIWLESLTTQDLCLEIKEWFKNKDLLVEDPGCGSARKQKPKTEDKLLKEKKEKK